MIDFISAIAIIVPFSLLLTYKDKTRSFFNIFTIITSISLLLAILSQSAGVFGYELVFTINIIIAIVALYRLYRNKNKFIIKKPHINWLLLLSLFIIIFQFTSVHHNYTGEVMKINGKTTVTNNTYTYQRHTRARAHTSQP